MTNPTTIAKPDLGHLKKMDHLDHLEKLERTCPSCGARLEEQKCELKCPVCYYFKSCSDY